MFITLKETCNMNINHNDKNEGNVFERNAVVLICNSLK